MSESKLDFEQRQEATRLEDWVTDNPESASTHIVATRTELERLRAEIEVIAERADIRGETATAARLRRVLRD